MKILSINVCGIVSKLKCPDFLSYICNFDIIGLQETKTDDSDEICVPGFVVYMFNRQKMSNYRSGGIALLIRENIAPHVKVEINTECNLVKFFTVSKLLYGDKNSNFDEDLKCGIVYIPPVGSKYSHADPYYEIQNEIFRYFSNSKHCILFGDYNARCGNLLDYTMIDGSMSDMFDLQHLQNEEIDVFTNFNLFDIPLNRRNIDNTVTQYGHNLLDMCRNNYLFLWNGRIKKDYLNPKLTCKNSSTVDYFLSSSYVFENIVDFKVDEFCSLYSDVHSPLYAILKTKHSAPLQKPHIRIENVTKTKSWDSKKSQLFTGNIDIIKISEIETKLDQLVENNTNIQTEIDDVVSDISLLFNNCSKISFGTVNSAGKEVNECTLKNNYPWFNRSCHRMRDVYHKTRKAYNKYKTPYFKELLKTVSNQYKQTLRNEQYKFNSNRIDKLRRLKDADPKQYWNILNAKSKQSKTTASLEDFYDFFKTLNENVENEEPVEEDINYENVTTNEDINRPITEEEILIAVKGLKNNKAPGSDEIINEQIKHSIHSMIKIYTKLFNIVFDKGIVPHSWTVGLIKPIYKNKGSPKEPGNYRPISLLSCFGKLFTCILNTRLNKFAEKSNLIHETQAGFRKNYSTVDNIFILKSLIDLVQSDKKKMFCCFIDFKQAFDSVWRPGLWGKLRNENINGKCLNIIKSLYSNIKSKVVTSEGSTPFFNCLVGVRQGENLSPFLFSIFLNDLEEYLRNNGVYGVSKDTTIDGAHMYLKLFILLYADDTVIFSDNEIDLHNALNKFKDYCDLWRLNINVDKTKILFFSKGRPNCNKTFTIGEHSLEIVNEYKYLGLFFTKSGSFFKTKQYIAEQANKAMFALLRKIKSLSLPYDLQIELFDKTIKPILLYGSEIWGFGNVDILERVQLKFYKYIFNMKKSTPSYMIYGELGVVPLSINMKNRVIAYWTRIIDNIESDKTTKLASKLYIIMHDLHNQNKLKSQWLDSVKYYLCSLGFSGIWYSQSFINSKWLIKSSYQKLKDIFIQDWFSEISQTSVSNIYKYIKTSFNRNEYVNKLPLYLCKRLIAFFTRNHRLPIETGRWQNIPANERKCPNCTDIGDEFHYLFNCPIFNIDRRKYLERHLINRPNMPKFIDLFKSDNFSVLKNLSLFCDRIMNYFK